MENNQRLQKYLSECGVASRRGSEVLITEGRVKVNGKIVNELGSKINPEIDKVEVDSKLIQKVEKGIILLNKPKYVITTMFDPEGRKCIKDFLTQRYRSYFPVGRLDYESSGLVILTNDGELGEVLLHPKYEIERIYRVQVYGHCSEALCMRIEKGVKLEDGIIQGKAILLSKSQEHSNIEISIRSGKNRVIRRMMETLGFEVTELKRIKHGPFNIGNLKPGDIRKLSEAEYYSVRKKLNEYYLREE